MTWIYLISFFTLISALLHKEITYTSPFTINSYAPIDGTARSIPSSLLNYTNLRVSQRFEFTNPGKTHLVSRTAQATFHTDNLILQFFGKSTVSENTHSSLSLKLFESDIVPSNVTIDHTYTLEFGPVSETYESFQVFFNLKDMSTLKRKLVQLTNPPRIAFNDGLWHLYGLTIHSDSITISLDGAILATVPLAFHNSSIWTTIDQSPVPDSFVLPTSTSIKGLGLQGYFSDSEPQLNGSLFVSGMVQYGKAFMNSYAYNNQLKALRALDALKDNQQKQQHFQEQRASLKSQIKSAHSMGERFALLRQYFKSFYVQYLQNTFNTFEIIILIILFIGAIGLVFVGTHYYLREQKKKQARNTSGRTNNLGSRSSTRPTTQQSTRQTRPSTGRLSTTRPSTGRQSRIRSPDTPKKKSKKSE